MPYYPGKSASNPSLKTRPHLKATSGERAASTLSVEAETFCGRPIAFRLAPSLVAVGVERHHHRPARDDHSLASDRLPPVLALEVARSWRSSKGSNGDPAPDPKDEPGQPAMGRAAHPRRAAEARGRGRSVDSRQIHGEEGARAVADLEGFSPQSCGRHCRHGLPDRADSRLPVALRFGHPQAPTAAANLSQRDDQSNGGVDRPPDHRCVPVERGARLSHSSATATGPTGTSSPGVLPPWASVTTRRPHDRPGRTGMRRD